MINKIDHIGIAVESIDAAREIYEKALGLSYISTEEVPEQKVKVAFFKAGEVNIELLEPISPESPIAKFLEKKGPGIHHLAFATDGILDQISQVEAAGCKMINKEPTKGAHDKQVAFIHPKSTLGVLTELCQ